MAGAFVLEWSRTALHTSTPSSPPRPPSNSRRTPPASASPTSTNPQPPSTTRLRHSCFPTLPFPRPLSLPHRCCGNSLGSSGFKTNLWLRVGLHVRGKGGCHDPTLTRITHPNHFTCAALLRRGGLERGAVSGKDTGGGSLPQAQQPSVGRNLQFPSM